MTAERRSVNEQDLINQENKMRLEAVEAQTKANTLAVVAINNKERAALIWGILALGTFVMSLLGGIAAFFVKLKS